MILNKENRVLENQTKILNDLEKKSNTVLKTLLLNQIQNIKDKENKKE